MGKFNLTPEDPPEKSLDAIALEIQSLNMNDTGIVIISVPEGFPDSAAETMSAILRQVVSYTESKGIDTSLGVIIWRGPIEVHQVPGRILNDLGWYKRKPRKKKVAEDAG